MNDIHPRLHARLAVAKHREDIPETDESRALARAAQHQEREQARKACPDLEINEDGMARIIPKLRPLHMLPIEAQGIPLDVRVACGEAIDAAVEQWGFEACLRAFRLVAALNHRYLRVMDEDEVNQ